MSIIHRRGLNQAMIYASRAPRQVFLNPRIFVRALRSALRMSQATLARRCELPQAHIARLEAGRNLLLLPLPRKRLGDALAEQQLIRPLSRRIWDD